MQNGVSTSWTTTIFLNGNRERPLNVFCDMETGKEAGVAGWCVAVRSPWGLYQRGCQAREAQADGTATYFSRYSSAAWMENGLLEGLGGLRPWFWEHLWGVLAG